MHEPPAGWARRSLGDVAEECTGRNGEDLSPDSVFGVFKGQGLRPMKDRVRADKLDRYKHVQGGWFAFNPMRINIGSIARNNRTAPVLVSPDYVVFRCREELIAPDFLDHVRAGADWTRFVENAGQGSVRVRIYFDDLAKMPLLLPPLAEQRKIAAILSSVDETIEKTAAVIAQLDVVKKAMLEELVTRGIPGRHSRFKQTEIGEVPADWEVHQVGQLGEVQTGLAKNKNNRVQHVDEVPYLSVANVQDGWLDLDHVKRVRADAATIERFCLRVGDVLFCEGGDADKVGRGAVWSGGLDPCLHQNHVFVVRPDSRRLLPEFLSAFRASSRGRRYFLDCSKQTTNLASINSSQLRAMPLALPSVAEQAEIVRAVDSIERRCSAERDCLGLLVKSKAALSSALLSGEVRTCLEAGVECS